MWELEVGGMSGIGLDGEGMGWRRGGLDFGFGF